jgi:hypothetical protein
MLKGKTEILFPPHLIPELGQLRDQTWQELVARIVALETEAPEKLAFVFMMVRLGGCVTCHSDSYWAMQGCRKCAQSTINRFRGTDDDLLQKYEIALRDLNAYLEHGIAAQAGGHRSRTKGKKNVNK